MHAWVDSCSVEERVLDGFLVPLSLLVEDEDLASGCIAEAHVRVEHVDLPHQEGRNLGGVDLLQVANVNVVAVNGTEKSCLLEHNLLCVREQLRVPGEMAHSAELSGHLNGKEEQGHDGEVRHASDPAESEANGGVVSHLTHDNMSSIW